MALFQIFMAVENDMQNAFSTVAIEESLNALFLNPNLLFNVAENRSEICYSHKEGSGWCQGVT